MSWILGNEMFDQKQTKLQPPHQKCVRGGADLLGWFIFKENWCFLLIWSLKITRSLVKGWIWPLFWPLKYWVRRRHEGGNSVSSPWPLPS